MSKSTGAQQTKTAAFTPAPQNSLQRKCACGNHSPAGGECSSCAQKKIQRKLAVGATNDVLEQEADRVADAITGSASHSFKPQPISAAGNTLQRDPLPDDSAKPREQPTAFPVQEQPKQGQEKADAEKDKLLEGAKKAGGEVAKLFWDGFSNSQTGQSILAQNKKDWQPIITFFKDFADTTVGKVVLGTAGAGAATGAFLGARAARDEAKPTLSLQGYPVFPRAPKDEKFFSLELKWDFVSAPSAFTFKTPWLDLPEIGGDSKSAPPAAKAPAMIKPTEKVPNICTPADPQGDNGEAVARSAQIYNWLRLREQQDAELINNIVRKYPFLTPNPTGLWQPGQPYKFVPSQMPNMTPMFKRNEGAMEIDDPAAIEAGIQSSGQSLDTATRSEMEAHFGRDLSQVRIHTGSQAAAAAQAVSAQAFTLGRDIVFGAGRYAPGAGAGKHLLAHELTHVVQQTSPEAKSVGAPPTPVSAQTQVPHTPVSPGQGTPVIQRSPQRIQRDPLTEAEARQRIAEIESTLANSSQSPEGLQALETERNQLLSFLRAPVSRPAPVSRVSRPRAANAPSAAEERAQRSDPALHDSDETTSVPNQNNTPGVPRPDGLPMSGGYTLYQVVGAPPGFLQSIPENSITTVNMDALAANDASAQPGPFTPTPGTGGTSLAGAGAATLQNSARALSNGLIPTSGNAIGLVSYPSSGNLSALEKLASMGPRNGVPAGHTAMVIVRDGRVSVVGFKPASSLEAVRNYGGLFNTGEGAASSVPARITNDAGIFRNPMSRQVMWEISPETASRISGSPNPEQALDAVLREVAPSNPIPAGAPEGGFTEYTGRMGELGRPEATNCVGWACNAIERRVGEAPRARMNSGAIEPIAPEGVGRLQGRMMQATGEGASESLAGVAPRAAGMSRTLRFMRVGGRVFLVVGVVISAVEVGRALNRRDYRSATQEVGGFATGFATGAVAGLVCGPGAPLCSLGLGLVFGIGGYFAGRALAGAAYDRVTAP